MFYLSKNQIYDMRISEIVYTIEKFKECKMTHICGYLYYEIRANNLFVYNLDLKEEVMRKPFEKNLVQMEGGFLYDVEFETVYFIDPIEKDIRRVSEDCSSISSANEFFALLHTKEDSFVVDGNGTVQFKFGENIEIDFNPHIFPGDKLICNDNGVILVRDIPTGEVIGSFSYKPRDTFEHYYNGIGVFYDDFNMMTFETLDNKILAKKRREDGTYAEIWSEDKLYIIRFLPNGKVEFREHLFTELSALPPK